VSHAESVMARTDIKQPSAALAELMLPSQAATSVAADYCTA
jgi:hypothetical protein